MVDKILFEKIILFIVCLCFPLLIICLILNMYSNFKTYEFIKFHGETYVYHQYCFKIGNLYACSDDYALSED